MIEKQQSYDLGLQEARERHAEQIRELLARSHEEPTSPRADLVAALKKLADGGLTPDGRAWDPQHYRDYARAALAALSPSEPDALRDWEWLHFKATQLRIVLQTLYEAVPGDEGGQIGKACLMARNTLRDIPQRSLDERPVVVAPAEAGLRVSDLLAWFRGRPGISWKATIIDIEEAVASLTGPVGSCTCSPTAMQESMYRKDCPVHPAPSAQAPAPEVQP